jgi:hypothetical protein
MKIEKQSEYEENHKLFIEINDSALVEYFLEIQDLYEMVSAEIAYRISKGWKKNDEKN